MDGVKALAAEINMLSPPQKLRMAADLIERGVAIGVAYALAEGVAAELGKVVLMQQASLTTGTEGETK